MSTCRRENSAGKKCALKNSFAIAGAMRARHAPGQRRQDHRHVQVALVVGREHDGPAASRSRCSRPCTRTHAKSRASGRIQVELARRAGSSRTGHVRFHDGKSTGSATSACCGAAVDHRAQIVERLRARELASRRCASGTDPRAPPSARRARASSGRALRSTCRRRAARAPANFASSACSGSPLVRGRRRLRAGRDPLP